MCALLNWDCFSGILGFVSDFMGSGNWNHYGKSLTRCATEMSKTLLWSSPALDRATNGNIRATTLMKPMETSG